MRGFEPPTSCSPYKESWKTQVIQQIEDWDARLEKIAPYFFLQKKIDEWAKYIESCFSPFYQFNAWLNSNGEGSWQLQLATFLAKLPIRSSRNIFQRVYEIIQTTLYTTVHPLKSAHRIAKNLILLIDELQKPETWAQMGTAATGTMVGQAWGGGTSYSILGIGVAASLAVIGLSLASLQASLKEQKGLVKLASESIKMPEIFLTGALMGVLIGTLQKKLKKNNPEKTEEKTLKHQRESSVTLMEHEQIDRFIAQNNLPPYTKVITAQDGSVTLLWDSQEALCYFAQKHPKFFQGGCLSDFCPLDVTITLNDSIPSMKFRYSYKVYTYDGYDPWIYTTIDSRIKLLNKYSK